MRAAIAFLLLSLLAYLPQASTLPWKGTEGRRVQIAIEMAENHDWVLPTLAGEPTMAKPPLYYWCLALVHELLGPNRTAMRMVSALALLAMACVAYQVLRRSHNEAAGWIAGLGILSAPVLLYHMAAAEIDPLFAVLTAISLLLLGTAIASRARDRFAIAGFVGGLALLTKGPPYCLFLAGCLLVWWRHARLAGLLWFVIPLLLPPAAYYAILLGRGDVSELLAVAGQESIGRAFLYEWKHVVDIPMHLVRAVLVVMPLGLWTLAEFRGRHEARLEKPEIILRICTAAPIGAVGLLLLFPGRSVRYLLPAVILFLCAVAPAVAAFARFPQPLRCGQRTIVLALGCLAALALLTLPWLPWPAPGWSAGLALGLAVAPVVVTSRPRLIAYAMAAPVLAALTAFVDRATLYAHGPRSATQVGSLVQESLRRAKAVDLASFGHFDYTTLFGGGFEVRGDEFANREPVAQWLLIEEPTWPHDPTLLRTYRDRVRIRTHHKTIVIKERRGP